MKNSRTIVSSGERLRGGGDSLASRHFPTWVSGCGSTAPPNFSFPSARRHQSSTTAPAPSTLSSLPPPTLSLPQKVLLTATPNSRELLQTLPARSPSGLDGRIERLLVRGTAGISLRPQVGFFAPECGIFHRTLYPSLASGHGTGNSHGPDQSLFPRVLAIASLLFSLRVLITLLPLALRLQ